VCGWSGAKFKLEIFPEKPGPVKLCPQCNSSERHRLAHVLLDGKLGANCRTLHFAPEPGTSKWLKSFSPEYLSVDISSPRAMRHMDITNLDLDDSIFGLVWCSHVLEHIPDDKKAMSEIFRVTSPGGMAVIQVPIYGETTYEDPNITAPEDRLKHFKQEDHVRLYGLDVRQRLSSVGFEVKMLDTADVAQEEVDRQGLEYPSTREIFLCSKP
jgi:SAM-dependent methyltransferase